ncbi:EscE/YscE/SsaE family type III secretion system needle protein co-chaperone [Yersinia pestis]|uniref:Type 3 secretion system chaperone YscE n=11 Tax=Yersinia pseudotuberculosis complex TaxID=1649845 RepID=YSCE_YERPE|nr:MULTISPECIES: type III secretion system co-chaperone YscE [Yersinia pseudotuberculosis complex]O68692.1 RecName: Full=Type 3 secretion system chaperone YscE; AltName: Full=Yersinia secretion component E; AltName: Full=Yop proteins translocation protein E [Yersinia pestis]1ZW0_A Chain A, type III secretion protein [Yersinia pestis]1ZW0_B Chain B, type III secretion protein [Yersinia pestis]1ZW0_C Chain C, type III secretion protein [Yersinia pestis]1ZW0_D Chain D, type III secretion protein 
MTQLEEQLHNVETVRSITMQLEMALTKLKKDMMRGGDAKQYQVWQRESKALESAIAIIHYVAGDLK